jgi:NADH dehydrogenase
VRDKGNGRPQNEVPGVPGTTDEGKTQVIIIGGGFGGLNAAAALGGREVAVTVIDRKNYHTFQPLLYQVATAGLSPGEIAAPIRGILGRHKNVTVLLGEVVGFDLARRRVGLGEFDLGYDYLILAAGASHSYFGHDEWERQAPGLKTIEDALEIRRRVLLAFERAEREAMAGGNPGPLDFVVVGGGPTGVELAGTLAEITRGVLARDFRRIDPASARIVLVEGAPRVLPSYPEDLSRSAERQLRKLGVEVLDSTTVIAMEPGRVKLRRNPLTGGGGTGGVGREHRESGGPGEAGGVPSPEYSVPSTVTLWAAGVAASPLGRALGLPTDRAGRLHVESDLSVPGRPEVFVIGDLAAVPGPAGRPLPGLAPVAMQEGRAVAKNILRDLAKKPRRSFRYADHGTMATIGRAAAVCDFGRLHVSGFIAWVLWLFVHILYLVGFRNRLLVLIEWAWSYFTYERSARLITGNPERRDQAGGLERPRAGRG